MLYNTLFFVAGVVVGRYAPLALMWILGRLGAFRVQ